MNYIKHKSRLIKLLSSSVLVLTLIISSCEELLDLRPYSQSDEDASFSTPSLVKLSVTGMYQAAQIGDYKRGVPWGAEFVHLGDARGEDVVNSVDFSLLTPLYMNTYNGNTNNIIQWWNDAYVLINRCNCVLEGVQTAANNGIITQELANQYKGEALVFRAITHFEFLMHYSRPYLYTPDASHYGVPYREKAITSKAGINEGMKQGRNSVAECYQKILADLDLAEQYLPTKAQRGGGKTGITRLTREATAAFKTRVYLHKYDWAKVISEGSKFLAGGVYSGSYTLTASPGGPFSDCYGNTESIFSIENSGTNNPGLNGALAQIYKARQLVCISPILWRDPAWLPDDKRRTATTEAVIPTPELVWNRSGRMYTNKYKDVTNRTDASPLMRYAEVLLNLAEAYARTGDVVNGLANLNTVRNRALANPSTQAYTAGTFATNVQLLGAILKERRIEFLQEGRRWPDIHRLQYCPFFSINGIPAKYANTLPPSTAYILGTPFTGPYGVSSIPYSDYRFLLPIPQLETDANPKLAEQQNPGW